MDKRPPAVFSSALSADNAVQEHDGRDHHYYFGNRLRPQHTAEAEYRIEQQKQRYVKNELADESYSEGILRLDHCLK